MLAISRRSGEGLTLSIPAEYAGSITLIVKEVHGGKAMILVDAPKEVTIYRNDRAPDRERGGFSDPRKELRESNPRD